MREDILVSIVVPIYKTEKYLERCINSIVSQTYEKLEIILVDDGSPDKCPQICDAYAEIDSRVVVVHKENQGLGMARNTGIEISTGNYICFFDSDDFIENNAIEILVEAAEKHKAQIVSFGFKRLDSELTCRGIVKTDEMILFQGKDRIHNDYIPEMICPCTTDTEIIGLWMSMWSSMFSLDYIKRIGWRCVSERDIISEDVYSLLDLYKKVDCVIVLDKVLYNYCDNGESLSRVFRVDRLDKINEFYDKTRKLCIDLSYEKKITDRIASPYIDFNVAALKQLYKAQIPNKYSIYKSVVSGKNFRTALDCIEMDRMSRAKKIFLLMIKRKCYFIGYLMLHGISYASFCMLEQ